MGVYADLTRGGRSFLDSAARRKDRCPEPGPPTQSTTVLRGSKRSRLSALQLELQRQRRVRIATYEEAGGGRPSRPDHRRPLRRPAATPQRRYAAVDACIAGPRCLDGGYHSLEYRTHHTIQITSGTGAAFKRRLRRAVRHRGRAAIMLRPATVAALSPAVCPRLSLDIAL